MWYFYTHTDILASASEVWRPSGRLFRKVLDPSTRCPKGRLESETSEDA